ncbi:MAG: hypothetical protein EXS35_07120 [Pedosphaera sp.]|nr:hypothetical protein [Pedosphaera sp.]
MARIFPESFRGFAQSYSIDWSKIASGGGASTNGQYSVTGGFWALPTAIQGTGAPTLTIAPATSGNIRQRLRRSAARHPDARLGFSDAGHGGG